ncbi:hypothetical protein ACSBR2_026629 [Camellia fascicularis]
MIDLIFMALIRSLLIGSAFKDGATRKLITCEICSQVYSPNYILPPKRNNPEVISIDIRHLVKEGLPIQILRNTL